MADNTLYICYTEYQNLAAIEWPTNIPGYLAIDNTDLKFMSSNIELNINKNQIIPIEMVLIVFIIIYINHHLSDKFN